MTSDPTDLIRSVDVLHIREGEFCRECGDPWPCEVRRLRDALEASETETERAWNAHNEAQEKLHRAVGRAASRAAGWVDANAEIERLRQVCRDHRVHETWVLGVDPNHEHVHVAMKGQQ